MRRAAGAVLLLGGLLQATGAGAQSRGEALYRGWAPLSGVIAGQATPMPAKLLACANCHDRRPGQAGGDAQPAPELRGGWLLQIRSRRNGPAGRYTPPSFCRALRTGTDPVFVVLPVQMPRFSISDQDCDALWAYLNPPAEGENPP